MGYDTIECVYCYVIDNTNELVMKTSNVCLSCIAKHTAKNIKQNCKKFSTQFCNFKCSCDDCDTCDSKNVLVMDIPICANCYYLRK